MTSPFLDIEKIVNQWAWTKYNKDPTRKQRRLKDKHDRHEGGYIGLRIDWSGCQFTDTTSWAKLEDDPEFQSGSGSDAAAAADQASSPPTSVRPSDLATASASGNEACALFKTQFQNNTSSVQTYSMNIQKTTKSTCETEVESGITRGFELGVTLKMPCEILEMNAGYSQEVSLTKTTGETFEEELQWGASTEISVESRSIAEAELLVREKKQCGKFVVTTHIRGYVGVTFTDLRDNNSFLKRTDGDIAFIVKKYLDNRRQKCGEEYDFIEVTDDGVIVKTRGVSHFRFGVKQEVKVDQRTVGDDAGVQKGNKGSQGRPS